MDELSWKYTNGADAVTPEADIIRYEVNKIQPGLITMQRLNSI